MRIGGSRDRRWPLVVAAVLCALYGSLALANGLDRMSAIAPVVAPIVPGPFRAEANRTEAALALLRGQGAVAERAATAMVRAAPNDYRSAALLGAARLQRKNYAGAEQAFRVAAAFGWRDRLTQLYWLEASLAVNDFPRATERLDALMRVNPDFPGRREVFARLEASSAGRQALATRLAENPQWARVLLGDVVSLSKEGLDRRIETWTLAGRAGARLGCEPSVDLARILLERNRPAAARTLWRSFCGHNPEGGLPADPQFAGLLAGENYGPFGWTRLPSGDVRTGSRPVSGGKIVLVADNSAPRALPVLVQSLDIAPGRYRLWVNGPDRASAALALDCGPPRRPDFTDSGERVAAISCRNPLLSLWLGPNRSEVVIEGVGVAGPVGQ